MNLESVQTERSKKADAQASVAEKLFYLKLGGYGRRIHINQWLFNQLLISYPDDKTKLLDETWKMFNALRKRWKAPPVCSSMVASSFVKDQTPEYVLKAVDKMVSDEAILDATLQLKRCPVWLDRKIKRIITMIAIDEESYAIHESSRLDYMGEYKRFKREVELY